MTCIMLRPAIAPAIAVALLASACAASAQESDRGFLDSIFGGSERVSPAERPSPSAPQGRFAQGPGSELIVRIDRLEAQIRQLTGVVEQLQYRNQQLEALLQELRGGAPRPAPTQARPASPATPVYPPASAPGRRSDVFDPAQNPTAPGVPRPLGSTTASIPLPQQHEVEEAAPPIGAPAGRPVGAPLDLSTLAGNAVHDPSLATAPNPADEAPPARNPGGRGERVATLPPTDSPKDSYDLAYGYILRKDYALAEDAFRDFLRRYPADAKVPEAQYWLGESLFQRQRYRDAAEAFLTVSTKYETTAKAPEALLRLGQSLAGLGEKEAACASLGEVQRKYPRASVAIKQGVDREQKRVRC